MGPVGERESKKPKSHIFTFSGISPTAWAAMQDESDGEEGELADVEADFEDYLDDQLLAGALDDFMADAMPSQRHAPVAPVGVTIHAIKAYVQWNQTLATIAFPAPSSAWVYCSVASQHKQEWTLGPLRLIARHLTCNHDPNSSKIWCRPCLNKEKWRRRCETPVNIFLLYDAGNDGGLSATAALHNLQIVPSSSLTAADIQYYQSCEPRLERRSPFLRSVSTNSVNLQRVPSVPTPSLPVSSSSASLPVSSPSASPTQVATSQDLTIERTMLLCMRYQTNFIFASDVIKVLAGSPVSFGAATGVFADPLSSIVLAPLLPPRVVILMAHDSIRMLTWARISEPSISSGAVVMQMAFVVPVRRSAFAIATDPIGFTTDDFDAGLVLSATFPPLASGQAALLVLTSDGLTPSDPRNVLPYVVLLQI